MTRRPPTVVVDTNVFSADLLRTTRPLVDLYRPLLEGRRFLISFQTLAELEYGFQRRDWGPARLGQARDHVRRAEVVWPGPALLAAYVELRVACEREGHALAQPEHDADRWIAATAIHLSVPLVSHDGIFRGAPRLIFETALDA
jgi:predicted nucleic acid-binding protein